MYSYAMIVDDDPISVRIVEHGLRAMGVGRVASFSDFECPSERDDGPDLVVTEAVISGRTCLSLLARLGEQERRPIFVAVSRRASRTQVFELAASGVTCFIEKPFTSSSLVRAILGVQQRSEPRRAQLLEERASLEQRIQQYRLCWDLTVAETAVLLAACQGLNRAEVAAERGVSVNTVKTQIRAILQKAGSPTMTLLRARILAEDAPRPILGARPDVTLAGSSWADVRQTGTS